MFKTVLPLCICFIWATAGLASGQTIHLPPSTFRAAGPTTGNIPVRTEEDIDRERAQKATRCCKTKSSATPKSCSIHRSERVWDKNQGILFLDAAKKAEQIEKLAHGLKSKIKQTY